MWPDTTGIGARLDKYHRDPHYHFHYTVNSQKTKIDDYRNIDRDQKVNKVCENLLKQVNIKKSDSTFGNMGHLIEGNYTLTS